MKISKETTIEELVDILPESVRYLMQKGIRCIACGEPIWGTLEEAAKEKSFSDAEIEMFVIELNEMLRTLPEYSVEAETVDIKSIEI